MRQFSHVGGMKPRRSVFDLSHERKFDADMGLLYPVLVEDVIPGDFFNISNEVIVRFHQPLWAPLLHEVNVYVHTFFVAYRNLWHDDKVWYGKDSPSNTDYLGSWEKFLSGGRDGKEIYSLPKMSDFGADATYKYKQLGAVWDFLYGVTEFGPVTAYEEQPLMFPVLAYAYIWNEFYRDENLQDEQHYGYDSDKGVFRRNWEKDYFTSALPWQQKGEPLAMPVNFSGSTVFDGYEALQQLEHDFTQTEDFFQYTDDQGSHSIYYPRGTNASADPNGMLKDWLSQNHFSPGIAASFGLDSMRLAFQFQKFLERNARAGTRYTEMLRAHFGVAPLDERLDRPEYIGGSKSPVIFSEVIKTADSSSGKPQGYLTGHGLSADRTSVCKYHVKEHGIIMSLLSVMPRTAYSQGLERMWLRDTREDFYWPEFAHLSERPVFEEEILLTGTNTSGAGGSSTNLEIFGYNGIYDEYRQRRSTVHGKLRKTGTLRYWHLSREFSDNIASRPKLNSDFVSTKDIRKDPFPIPEDPCMMINYGNIITAVRPMPVIAEPGLIDHF
jgi:hypothetical protein